MVAYLRIPRDECSRRGRIERILDLDGYVLVVSREYGRRIDDLGSEVAQLHGFHESQMFYRVGVADDFRVGCHESVHVCPYFQRVSVQYGCQYGCRIVRSSSAEISHIAVGRVRTYESWHDGYVRQFREFLEYELFRFREIHYMLVEIWFGLDEFAGIVQDRTAYGPVHDDGRQPFTVADYRI